MCINVHYCVLMCINALLLASGFIQLDASHFMWTVLLTKDLFLLRDLVFIPLQVCVSAGLHQPLSVCLSYQISEWFQVGSPMKIDENLWNREHWKIHFSTSFMHGAGNAVTKGLFGLSHISLCVTFSYPQKPREVGCGEFSCPQNGQIRVNKRLR